LALITKTRIRGLDAFKTLEVPGRCETAGIQAFLEDGSQGMETIQIST
jgi:hypothetical protein